MAQSLSYLPRVRCATLGYGMQPLRGNDGVIFIPHPLTSLTEPNHDLRPIRNRIKAHRHIRASDLVPPEWNFRAHPDMQRTALLALYQEVGFARSLLANEMPDGRLKLVYGHLRRDLDPDMEVDVEILDVTDEEAQSLLLSLDPLAALAETQTQLYQRLVELTPVQSPELMDF